jgi:hypothetical protein
MSNGATIRHVVAIAGVVRAAPTGDGQIDHTTWREGRIADALIEIIAGPPAFETLVSTLTTIPGWNHQRKRIDRAWSAADGVFFFIDLPPGDYHLRSSVPTWGTRYGSKEIGPITVPPTPVGTRVKPSWAEITVPVTRVHGTVTHHDTGEAMSGVSVRLRGDAFTVLTKTDGSYELARLVQGTPLVEAVAPNFKIASRRVELVPGQDRTVNFRLEPRQS